MIVADRPGEARKLLEFLSEKMVNLLALTAFPLGGGESRIDFFPEDPDRLKQASLAATAHCQKRVGPWLLRIEYPKMALRLDPHDHARVHQSARILGRSF